MPENNQHDATATSDKSREIAAPGAADAPNRAEQILSQMSNAGKRVLVFVSVLVALAVFTIVAWFTFGDWWVRTVNTVVAQNTLKGFGYGLFLGLITVYFAFWMLRLAIMRKMPGSGRIAFSVIAGLLLVIPLFSLFVTLNPRSRFALRINVDSPGFQAGMLVGAFVALAAFVTTWISLHNLAKKRAKAKIAKADQKEQARLSKIADKEAEQQAKAAEKAAEEAQREADKQAKRAAREAGRNPAAATAPAAENYGHSANVGQDEPGPVPPRP